MALCLSVSHKYIEPSMLCVLHCFTFLLRLGGDKEGHA